MSLFDIMAVEKMTEELIKVKVSVRTNLVGSETYDIVEIPLVDWEAMSEEARDDYLLDEVFNMIEWRYGIIESGRNL